MLIDIFKIIVKEEQFCEDLNSQEILPLGRKLKLPCIISFKKILPLRSEGVVSIVYI